MRPFLPYNLLAVLTVLCCGVCALYNLVLKENYTTTLRYHYPAIQGEQQAEADPERVLPESGEENPPMPGAARGALTEVRFPLELNSATVEELKFIPRVGDATAQRIVQYREALGGYTELTQLMGIDGIGQKTFEHLYTYLYIETESHGEYTDEGIG